MPPRLIAWTALRSPPCVEGRRVGAHRPFQPPQPSQPLGKLSPVTTYALAVDRIRVLVLSTGTHVTELPSRREPVVPHVPVGRRGLSPTNRSLHDRLTFSPPTQQAAPYVPPAGLEPAHRQFRRSSLCPVEIRGFAPPPLDHDRGLRVGVHRAMACTIRTLNRIRTCGLWFRKPLLYPLSYQGKTGAESGDRGSAGRQKRPISDPDAGPPSTREGKRWAYPRQESNLQPSVPETDALSIELRRLSWSATHTKLGTEKELGR